MSETNHGVALQCDKFDLALENQLVAFVLKGGSTEFSIEKLGGVAV